MVNYRYLLLSLLLTAGLSSCRDSVPMPEGKQLYIPEDLQSLDLQDPEEEWSFHRMECTPNLAIFWQKGFGDSLSTAPALDEQDMRVDLHNLEQRIEAFYGFFRDTLHFKMPHSKADSTRMMVMLNYSLEGTAYGGTYDDSIGALWIAPNRVRDQKLNCIAHELGHSFQCQIGADRKDGGAQFYGFYEMASQWMLWQVNPDWLTDENYHYEAFLTQLHKAFLAGENIYRSPYVLQYWSDLRGRDVIGELFRRGEGNEDPFMTYKRIFGLSQQQMCDELFDACRHFVGLDYKHAWNETRTHADKANTPTIEEKGWLRPADGYLPENYGFNVYPIQQFSKELCVRFETLSLETRAGFRYGFVAKTDDGTYAYSPIGRDNVGVLRYRLPVHTRRAWLVVMASPNVHWRTDMNGSVSPKWPYHFSF